MSEVSEKEVRLVMPDGALLSIRHVQRGSKPKRNVLVLPQVGESLSAGYYEHIARHLLDEQTAVHLVELRAHPLSSGSWSLMKYRHDLAHLIASFKLQKEPLYVLAWGLSASTLLEYDDQAHTLRGALPPLPDGMLLFDPLFSGREILPKVRFGPRETSRLAESLVKRKFRSKEGYRLGALRLDEEDVMAAWREIVSYEFQPVRVQTPTVLLVPMDVHADPLKRVFGNVRLQRVKWLHHFKRRTLSAAESAHHLKEIEDAFDRLLDMDAPIRFKATR